jgi:hypothetical protein
MKVEPSKVEPKGWGDNAIMVILANCNEGNRKKHR